MTSWGTDQLQMRFTVSLQQTGRYFIHMVISAACVSLLCTSRGTSCVILTALEHLCDYMFVWFYEGPRGVVRTDELECCVSKKQCALLCLY